MSHDHIVSITILKQQRYLSESDFLKFKQMVSLDQVNHIKVPYSNFGQTMDRQKITVLNVLLYFITSVQSRFKVFPNDLNENKYRVLCVNQISHYYITNKMTIELRQFSFISGVILDLNFHECAHIIFYLIYGRFASHPYIKSLCQHVPNNKINFQKSKRSFLSHFVSSKRKSVKNSTQSQLNQFQQELKKILKPQSKKPKFNRGVIHKHFHQKQKKQDHFENKNPELSKDRKYVNEDTKINTLFPLRFSEKLKSFVIQSLPSQKTQQTFRTSSRMGLMRRQKFNHLFSENRSNQQKDYNLISPTRKQSSNQFVSSFDLALLEIGKIKINDLKNIYSQLRVQNLELDQARLYCSLKQNQYHSQQSDPRIQVQKREKNSKLSIQSHVKPDSQDFRNNQLELNLSHKLNLNKKHSKQEYALRQQFKQGEQINYFHSEETKRQNIKKDKNSKQFCAKECQGWKNANCKKRVQKFKKQYNQFLSMQLFQKVIQANQSDKI